MSILTKADEVRKQMPSEEEIEKYKLDAILMNIERRIIYSSQNRRTSISIDAHVEKFGENLDKVITELIKAGYKVRHRHLQGITTYSVIEISWEE